MTAGKELSSWKTKESKAARTAKQPAKWQFSQAASTCDNKKNKKKNFSECWPQLQTERFKCRGFIMYSLGLGGGTLN